MLGINLAGTVEQTADDVTESAPGDHVYGMTGGVGGIPGSLAEYTVVDTRLNRPSPGHLDGEASPAVPLAAISAWEGLVDRANDRPGHRVLIHGGAGEWGTSRCNSPLPTVQKCSRPDPETGSP